MQNDKLISNKFDGLYNCGLIQDSNFFLSIIHDLKSPLATFQIILNVLENEIKSGKKKIYILENIRDLKEVNEELKELVYNFLDLDLEKVGYDNQVNIFELCRKVAHLNCAISALKNIDIIVDVEQDLVFDNLDFRKLKQVLMNLVSNSIKFSLKDGIVIISAKKSTKDRLEIVVKDQGCGISEEDLPKIFDRNFSKSNVGDSAHGIGLATVKVLVEAMSGEIEVKSKIGEGTEFRIIFSDFLY